MSNTQSQQTEQLLKRISELDYKKRRALFSKLDQSGVKPGRLPIVPLGERDFLPLSYAQQRLWFLWTMEPDSTAYHIASALHVKGDLDVAALQQSFNFLIARHESLRTNFVERDGQPVQHIHPELQLQIEPVAVETADENALRLTIETEIQRPFNLENDSLLRVKLLRIAAQEHVLVITQHHIISDGWSIQLMVQQLLECYRGFSKNQPINLPVLPIQYADYAVWQRHVLEAGEKKRQLDYWATQLAGEARLLELPWDKPRPGRRTNAGQQLNLQLDSALLMELKQLAQRENTSLFMLLLAAFQMLLYRYSGQDEIRVGVSSANRNRAEIENLIGFFVNTQVLSLTVDAEKPFSDLLEIVRKNVLDAHANQDLPFDQLVEALQPERSLSHSPLFQVMFNYQVEHGQPNGEALQQLTGLDIKALPWENRTAKFDLTLDVSEGADDLRLGFNYATDLFEASTIERMATHWQQLLAELVKQPSQRIAQIPLLSAVEHQAILSDWNNTSADYDNVDCIHTLIEAQASKRGDAIAVTGPAANGTGQISLSYNDLNQRANQLAHHLRTVGVGPDVLVGIAVERSVDMLVGLLAILKAGGAYVPLDPDYPSDRLAYMIENSGLKLLLTQSSLVNSLPVTGDVRMVLLDDLAAYADYPLHNLPNLTSPDNLAYVIYTSGSTGKPKGALLAHRNVSRLFSATEDWFHFNQHDVWTLFHSYAFDFSVWEIFGALIYGGRLVVVPFMTSRSPEAFHELLIEEGVTVLNQTPSAFRQLMQVACNHPLDAENLRYVIFGGEALEVESLQPWFDRFGDTSPQLVNMYGITETTVHVTYRPLSLADRSGSPIGQVIPDLTWYVLDGELNPVIRGGIGELYVGQAGLARGYLKRGGLTSERFIPDPFTAEQGKTGGRLYRTGDLARYRADGVIEYVGRIDHQVKIRGFRIELGEIDARLHALDAIRDAAVLAIDIAGSKQLVAYLVPQDDSLVTEGIGDDQPEARQQWRVDIKTALHAELPDYMVPAHLVLLAQLPLTANGKLDRKALPAVDVSDAQQVYVAPQNALEQQLADIWQAVLGLEQVGLNDNFFELGGHSLLATQVISRLRNELALEVPLRSLFETPTLTGFAARVAESQQQPAVPQSAIPLVSRAHPLPLSYAQQRQWMLWQLEPHSAAYHMSFSLRLRGLLDVAALAASFGRIIARHEVLRTHIQQDEAGNLQQVIDSRSGFVLDQIELPVPEHALPQQIAAYGQQPFDLHKGPLLKACLFNVAGDVGAKPTDTDYVLTLVQHHIISDAWSMNLLVNELVATYTALSQNQEPALPELPIQYADYAVWQRERLANGEGERQLDYWKNQLGDEHPVLELPTDRPRPQQPSYRGNNHGFQLEQNLLNAIDQHARARGVTRFVWLLAAFQTLLHRYSGQADIRVGTPVANRTRLETEHLIGFFVNTQVLRASFDADITFDVLLEQVRVASLEAQTHQDLPFEQLVEALQPERSLSHSPLFQVMFNYQVDRGQADSDSVQQLTGLEIQALPWDNRTAKFDLSLDVSEGTDDLRLGFNYATDLFDADTIERMAAHWQQLLAELVQQPGQCIAQAQLLSTAERQTIFNDWNNTAVNYGDATCIHTLIETQVAKRSDAIALVGPSLVATGETHLSYADLNRQANRLAHHLRARGVGPDVLVGIAVERSVEMVIGLLAILKAGGAYVPLDPDYPSDRLAYMMENSGLTLLLSQSSLIDQLPLAAGVDCILLDAPESVAGYPDNNPTNLTSPTNLAYVIYTSGSTGRPKGVGNSHRGLDNRLKWMQSAYGLTADDRVLQKTPFSFDVSVWEFFWPLLTGSRLVVAAPGAHRDPAQLVETIQRQGVTTLHFVPSMLQAFVQHHAIASCASITRVICSGEALGIETQRQLLSALPQTQLYNLYGPTEAAIDVTHWTCREEGKDLVPIGEPIANIYTHVLDGELGLLPASTTGELYLGGIGLARGYFNRPGLTAERFIPDAFAAERGEGNTGGRLYRTGDLARYRTDGVIEYVGRIDHQVKVRGFRIELGEIEARLQVLESVRDAAVLAVDIAGSKQLVAYVVPQDGSLTIDTEREDGQQQARQQWRSDVKTALHAELPDYMVPAHLVLLAQLPLTPNGKLDRKALPAVDASATQHSYIEPRTALEQQLAAIWQSVLGVTRVGLSDNFFDLGGHSLLVTRVISRIRQELALELPLRSLFDAPELGNFAAKVVLANNDGAGVQAILPVSRHQPLPLSYAQQRQWVLWQLEPESNAYHMSASLRLEGALDIDALERSFDTIIARHEVLRTRIYQDDDGQPRQYIEPKSDFRLEVESLPTAPGDDALRSRLVAYGQRPFNLHNGALLRASLLLWPDTDSSARDKKIAVLALVQHHIISDAWSMNLLVNELVATYIALSQRQEPALPELPIQYADYAVWQRERLANGEGERQLDYWKNQLGDEHPILELPTDRPRPQQPSYQGNNYGFRLEQDLVNAIDQHARERGVTRFMWLLAAFQTLLHRHSGQADIRVGTPVANRTRLETEHLIGFFVNTQVLRASFTDDITFDALLEQVRLASLEAQTHQDLPFEQLVEALQPERSLSHSPLFQVMFNYQVERGQPNGEALQQLTGLDIKALPWENRTAKFDLTLDISEGADDLRLGFNYATDLFEAGTIERMATHWQQLLAELVKQPTRRIAQIPLLSAVEHQAILGDWNNASIDYGDVDCIHTLIEARVAERGDAIAVTGPASNGAGQISLSYNDLNQRANQLAHYLRTVGVGPDVLVGIAVERSVDMLVGLLAILKAGGAYVPLDPDYPSDRLAYMIDNSGLKLLLTQSSLVNSLPVTGDVRMVLLDDLAAYADYPIHNPSNLTSPDNLAYVIYTSGSTGKPKGALLAHRNVSRLFSATEDWFHFNQHDVWTLFHSYAFDFSVWEIFGALIYGGRLVVVPFMTSRSPEAFHELLIEEGVTVLNQTPSAFRQLMPVACNHPLDAENLRYVIFGGEALEVESLQPWFDRFGDTSPQLVNMYGITETTVHVTYRPLSLVDRSGSPIGQVIPDLTWYVLDGELNPVIRGGIGELYVGQAGLARGYLKRGGLTSERFIPDPFTSAQGKTGGRLYRTGDLARYRADGVIEYVGRIDHQVKIRGFRIELGEIDARLHALDAIRDAAVLAIDIAGSKQLVAYLVPQDESLLSDDQAEARQQWRADIKTALHTELPDYMVPAHLVLLAQLPLTANGKLDRKALPAVDVSDAQQVYVAPQNALEQQLADIWQAVLGLEQVGLNDNFFELGGDSIVALQLVSRARQSGIYFTPKDVFQHQTLAALGLVASFAATDSSVGQEPITGSYPLTPIQAAFFERAIPQQHHWNQSVLLRPLQPINALDLHQALRSLVNHHDALRAHFSSDSGEWHGQFAEIETTNEPDLLWQILVADEAELGIQANRAQASFDLTSGPLLRAVLFTLPSGEQRLLLAIHHLAVDGVSWRILLEDLQAAYHQVQQQLDISLPAKTTSFKQWAEQLQGYAQSPALLAQLDYWQTSADVSRELPRDNPAGQQQHRFAASVSTYLDKTLTQQLLKEAPAAYRTQVNDLLLTALARVICRWTDESSALITLEGHGREDLFDGVDLSRTVGWFTSVFPVKLTPANAVETSIKAIKEQLRQIPEKGLGYGVLRYLGDEQTRKLCAALPEARITFNYLGQFDGSFSEDQAGLFVPISGNSGSNHSADAPLDNWLSINGQVYKGALELNWTFSTDVYQRETIQRLAQDLERELRDLIAHCLSAEAGGITPSDLIGLDMQQHELDQLLDEIL